MARRKAAATAIGLCEDGPAGAGGRRTAFTATAHTASMIASDTTDAGR